MRWEDSSNAMFNRNINFEIGYFAVPGLFTRGSARRVPMVNYIYLWKMTHVYLIYQFGWCTRTFRILRRPRKTGFEMSVHDMANRWTPKINYGKKRVTVICSNTPLYAGKNNFGKSWALPRIIEKRFRSHPGNFEPLRGKPNYATNRRQATSCLS